MAVIKSHETLMAEMRTFLKAYNDRLDTGENSLSKDLLLTPMSIGGRSIMEQVEIARDLAVLSKNTGGDLINLGTNYRLEKLPGSYAVTTLTFYTTVVPTSDIVIPASTQGSTPGTSFASPVVFSTVSEASFTVADAASYFSFDRGRYEFPVVAICEEIGSAGRVGANYVSQLIGSLSGIEGVTNLTASTGGLEEESDDDFRLRIQLKMTGRELNTVNGLRKYMKDVGFTDGYPIRVEDEDGEKATGIDVFVLDNSSETATEIFTYDPSQNKYYFTNRPVLEVTSVVGSNVGTIDAANYTVNIDKTSQLRRSIYSNDYIRFSLAAALSTGEQVTIIYNYSPLIVQAQGTLDLVENEILTADPLIKRAFPLFLFINAKLTLKANADGPTVRNKVKNALSQYANAYRLGDDLQKSDLVVVMQEGYGDYPIDSVDAIVINSYYLQDAYGVQYDPVDEVISVSNKQYIVYGAATIT